MHERRPNNVNSARTQGPKISAGNFPQQAHGKTERRGLQYEKTNNTAQDFNQITEMIERGRVEKPEGERARKSQNAPLWE